jgi:hypothetical protein
VNGDEAACGPLDELRSRIRKRDKRIGGFGHEQFLELEVGPTYGIAA